MDCLQMIYTELLEVLNTFMDNSGLRDYCRTECKSGPGDGCCDGKYQTSVCDPGCREQLVCVAYTCNKLNKLLPAEQARALRTVNKAILRWAAGQFGNAYCHNYNIETVRDAEIPVNSEALGVIKWL